MLQKRSMVLSGKGNQKAVLSMEKDMSMLRGKVRLYNFSSEPRGIISLGLYENGKVVKAGLTKVSPMLFSFQTQLDKMPEHFSCAIVNFVEGEPSPILFGASEGESNRLDVFEGVFDSLKSANSADEVEDILDAHGIDFDDELQSEIDEAIEKEFSHMQCQTCNDCENCKYKKFYFSHVTSLNEEEIEKPQEQAGEEKSTFYSEIKEQIEKLFKENKPEDYLEELIPSSKWVKVELEEGGDYYVFGLIYEGDELKYVCYGVPGIYQKTPPRELSGYPVWFPLDSEKREGFGYWLTYQDAGTGESIKAIVE